MSGVPYAGYSIFNGLAPLTKDGPAGAPIQGPRTLRYPVTFSVAQNTVLFDFVQEYDSKQLDFIQTVFVDNRASALAVTVRALTTQHELYIPAGKQAQLQIYCADQEKFSATKIVVGADETIPMHFSNVAMPAWMTQA